MLRMRKGLYLLVIGILIIVLSAAILFSGCGTKEETKENGDTDQQTEEQAGTPGSITTEVDKEFAVNLTGNAGTGYVWTLAEEPDPKMLTKVWEDTYVHDLKPGAENVQVFKFKALAEGSTELKFQYSRPWETDVAPEKTHMVSVTVNKGNQDSTKEYNDPSVPIEVKNGDDFVIVLEANPSTGYTWELDGELDSTILRFESKRYGAPSRPEQAGAPQQEYWRFDTLGTGSAEIKFKYERSWEEGVEPEKTMVFNVNVTE
ncbi:MAG: protease inhibitor I42 family protein [Actinobacteria bacterium]|nr:protease inhibitor I42 family protein [Actinomycetota bacterium]